jgi:hypothetical protein
LLATLVVAATIAAATATTTTTTTTHNNTTHRRRSLLVADDDPGTSEAYPMDDPQYEFNRDIPLSDPRLRKPGGKGCDAGADGLRLSHWGPGAVLVSFSTCNPVIFPPAPGRPAVDGPAPDSKPPPPPPPIGEGEWAVEIFSSSPRRRLLKRVPVDPQFTLQYESHFPDRKNGDTYAGGYRSGRISHVLLDRLKPGGNYQYRVVKRQRQQPANSSKKTVWEPKSPLRAFEAPWSPTDLESAASKSRGGYYRIGIVGDPGQTPDSARTIKALGESGPRHVVIVGDIAYADNFLADGTPMSGGGVPRPDWYTQPGNGEQTFEFKFDTSARLLSPVLSRVPLLTTPGNHDYLSHNYTDRHEKIGYYFMAYNARFPVPDGGGHWSFNEFGADALPPPTSAPPMMPREQLEPVFTETADQLALAAPTNLFYSTEVPGATLLFLTAYNPAPFGPGTAQYEFAERVLRRVDRERTPWVIVFTHGNLYSTYDGHFKELECFRREL